MALKRYTKVIDGTIPVVALLYDDEELLGSQDSVGIYDGPQKALEHQNGAVHASSHRLFYVDAQYPETGSFELDLAAITRTEHYAGLFTSSPKVTLHLAAERAAAIQPFSTPADEPGGFETWECQVCAYRNPPGLSPAAARVCGLCGVPREALPSTGPSDSEISSTHHLSSSLPSSGVASPSLPPSPSPFRSGAAQDDAVPCPACTFLNHPSLRKCEICDTQLPRYPQSRRGLKSAPVSRPLSPEPHADDPATRFIRVSFRKGGDKVFYGTLKRGLQSKAWEKVPKPVATNPDNRPSVGISGILRTVESSAQDREDDIKDALQDLEALMVKAKDMARLAAELNEKLTAATQSRPALSAEPEEATFIRSSLSQLGLQLENAPVTQDMVKDERKWFEELARELAVVLQKGMMRERGLIALDEVWGGWNRARGVALIPPSTFLQVLPLLKQYTNPPILQRTFGSGLRVLHTPPYGREAFATRLSGYLVSNGPKTTMEVAVEEGLAVALVREMIEAGEADGDFCRDDVGEAAIVGGGSGTGVEVRWWPNVFVGYVWDGQD